MSEVRRTDAGAVPHGAHGNGAEKHHPGPGFYVMIGVILTVITAIEVAIYYIEALDDYAVAILVPLSTAKFILVVMFYMHLKFDSKLFSGVFLAPLALAVAVIVSMVLLFTVLPFIPA